MTDFELTDVDKSSSLWRRFRAHLAERLDDARTRNDRVQPEPDTAAIRGEIKCLKALIGLGEDKPDIG